MIEKNKLQYDISLVDEFLMNSQKESLVHLMRQLGEDFEESYYNRKVIDMQNFIKDGSAVIFVALIHNKAVGYIWGYPRGSRVHVTQFVVDENYRSSGIGNKLMQHIEDWTNEHGFEGVELNVLAQNHRGLNFYKKNGFVCENLFLVKKIS